MYRISYTYPTLIEKELQGRLDEIDEILFPGGTGPDEESTHAKRLTLLRDRTEPLPIHLAELAASMLDDLSERMGNAGCNDWDFPEGWTQGQIDGLSYATGISGTRNPTYLEVVNYLAGLLRGER